jgi:xanthine dehydrogenase YagS FAD-binding subunit
MNRFAWATPRTAAEAAALASGIVADAMTAAPEAARSEGLAVVKAGGIDLLDLMKDDLLAPAKVVSLKAIAGLDAISEDAGGGMRIGAAATLAKLAENASLRARYPAVADAVGGSASPQIRNVATLGGNLLQRPRCWYFRAAAFRCLRKGGGHCFAIDGENQYHAIFNNRLCAIVHPSTVATPLVALGATVELTDAEGMVREVSLEDFFTPPDRDLQRENQLKAYEILTAVRLPAFTAAARTAHLKLVEKESFDWPLADVAVVLELDADEKCTKASIVLGAAAPVPYRARMAESILVGQTIKENLARKAGRAALEGATPLARNAYKLPLFETLVRRTIMKAVAFLPDR